MANRPVFERLAMDLPENAFTPVGFLPGKVTRMGSKGPIDTKWRALAAVTGHAKTTRRRSLPITVAGEF